MYKCNECGEVFEEPEKLIDTYESIYGIASQFPSQTKVEIAICPYCSSDDIEEYEEEE